MISFPPQAPVKQLDQKHPDYAFYNEAWSDTLLLYKGGVALREAVISKGRFLLKNTRELPEVYATRQQRFSYTNLLGNIVGWYISALFKQPPQIDKKLEGATGEEAINKIPQDIADFCTAFEADCDHAGTSLNDFCRRASETALLYQSAYVVIDLPAPADGDQPVSLADQKRKGLLTPFLVLYEPNDVINWECDAYGNIEWVCIKIRIREQQFLAEPVVSDYWYFFDRQNVALYERKLTPDGQAVVATGSSAEEMATLAAGYPRRHAMADQNRVPIRKVTLPEGLWLGNRVFLPLVNHLNLDNAHDFGLYQANLPQLCIEDGPDGKYEEPKEVTVSPVGYHAVPHGGKMYYLEPEGKAYATTEHRLEALEERIYKACYLMDQARTNRSTPSAQSGVSKQQDKTPSRDALAGIGDVIRPAEQSIYEDVLAIAGFSSIEPDIRGFDFSDRATAEDMDLLEQGTIVPVNSTRFEREIAKKNVTLTLPDLNPEAKQEIFDEIDENPTPSEVQAQQEEEQRQADLAKFTSSLKTSAMSGAQTE